MIQRLRFATPAVLTALAATLLLLAACADEDDADAPAEPAPEPSPWGWTLMEDGTVAVTCDDRVLAHLRDVRMLDFDVESAMRFGQFTLEKKGETFVPFTFVEGEGKRIDLMFGSDKAGELTFYETETGALRAVVQLLPAYNGAGIRLRFELKGEDRFWGFGEQYNFVDARGRTVPVWVSEQGLGREDGDPRPPKGSYTDTYFPMPYFLDPVRGFGFLLDNAEYSVFDLGDQDPYAWTVEVWNGGYASFLVFPGPEPANVIEQLTAEVGRARSVPPDWSLAGVWLAAQGGTDAVRDRVDAALDSGIPVTAVWSQDWIGQRAFGLGNYGVQYHWTQDEELYPGLETLVEDLNGRGVRFLGYFNPFVVPKYDQWDQAVAEGYLAQTTDGDPYRFLISVFRGGLADLTNPDACAWFQNFAYLAVGLGQSGWMADFGEWLPFDAVLSGGDAPAFHNLYPIRWAELNREILEAAYPDGDFVLFSRSGFTGSHAAVQIVWAGDQEASWDESDGLPTVVTAGLTIGLAGIPYFTHDVAGFSGGPSTKELYQRWTELGAFTPFMRTHDGLKKLENHRFDTDAETLAHFTRMARVHEALAPMLIALAEEAQETGLPIIRHTALVDPEWDGALLAHRQWMIGPDLLVAPVVTQGTEMVEVRFPEGEWEHLLTGERYAGRTIATVSAPIGRPAAFMRTDTWDSVVDAVRAAWAE